MVTKSLAQSAIEALEYRRSKIDEALSHLRPLLDEQPEEPVRKRRRKRRKMSPEGRRRIAEGQRKRWAAHHQAEAAATSPRKAAKKKRTMSAEGRLRIKLGNKKRWARWRLEAQKRGR